MASSGFDSTELPALAPRTHCVLIARDPNYVYAYWDYTEEDISRLRNQIKFEGESSQLVLRVYDATANHTWDLDVGFSTKNWYIHVWQDNADHYAEIGIRSQGGHFKALMRSNTVRTPPKTASKRDDLIWQDVKLRQESKPYIKENIKERYQRLMQLRSRKRSQKTKQHSPSTPPARVYQLSAHQIREYYMKLFIEVSPKGRGQSQISSIKDVLKGASGRISWQKVKPVITSPGLIERVHPGASVSHFEQKGGASENLSPAPSGANEGSSNPQPGGSEGRLNKRKFFFEIWTELLVYGRTEADATVLLNEKNIKLNPDGTFSLRYALPDGEIPLKFIAQSSDGVEQRHIHTRVEREKTIYFPKMLKEFHE